MQEIKDQEIIKLLLSLNLPNDKYTIFGSGTMFAHGIRHWDECTDLDIVAIDEAWDMVKINSQNIIEYDKEWDCEHITLFDGKIEIWNGWGPCRYNLKKLIARSEKIEGINFVSIPDLICWKLLRGKEKDKIHLEMIKEYILNKLVTEL
jgi:hypothetical protein